MRQYSSGTPKRSALISISAPQKGSKNSFKKPFRSDSSDKEKIPWKSNPIDKDKLKCSHCRKMRHTKENNWNLVRWFKNSASLDPWKLTQFHHMEVIWAWVMLPRRLLVLTMLPRWSSFSIDASSSQSRTRKYEQLYVLVGGFYGSNSSPSTTSFASTQSGTHATALHVSSTTSPSWIFYYGALDYMTGLSSLFS